MTVDNKLERTLGHRCYGLRRSEASNVLLEIVEQVKEKIL